MDTVWENTDSCEAVQAYFTLYRIPVAAALWCGISPDQVEEHLRLAKETNRAIFSHPYIPCLEPRCRAIHDAIEKSVLPCSRENGKVTDDHIAPERRHISRQHLKEWIAKEFPSEKPAFLFDAIERKTHSAINAVSFQALQADRDALQTQLEKEKNTAQQLLKEKEELVRSNQLLQNKIDKKTEPNARAEITYLNIIGALIELMLSKPSSNQGRALFANQTAIIQSLLRDHEGKQGIAERTLEEKFAEGRRSLKTSLGPNLAKDSWHSQQTIKISNCENMIQKN